MNEQHVVSAVPVRKLHDGVIGYRFECSCGRDGNGHHRTPEAAIRAGGDHVPCSTCGLLPNDPEASFCSNGVHYHRGRLSLRSNAPRSTPPPAR